MTELEIQTLLRDGMMLPGGEFRPIAFFARVDEPEFGCEGRPDQGLILGYIYGWDRHGKREWALEESALWAGGFDDRMWIGRFRGGVAALKEGATTPAPLENGDWISILGL